MNINFYKFIVLTLLRRIQLSPIMSQVLVDLLCYYIVFLSLQNIVLGPCHSVFLFIFIFYYILILCVGDGVGWSMCSLRSQRKTGESWFSLPSMWVSGVELSSSGFGGKYLCLLSHLPGSLSFYFKNYVLSLDFCTYMYHDMYMDIRGQLSEVVIYVCLCLFYI